MNSLRDRLHTWLTTSMSGFGAARTAAPRDPEPKAGPQYVLRGLPFLPGHLRTARNYRVVSVLSVGACPRDYLRRHAQLHESEFDGVMQRLLDERLVEIRNPLAPSKGAEVRGR